MLTFTYSQKNLPILWKKNVHYRVHKGTQIVPILKKQIDFSSSLSNLKIRFYIIHTPTYFSSK